MLIYDKINKGEVYIIAEMSANHDGKLENALEIVRAARKAGADCIKIQTYTADTMTIPCDNEYFRIKGGLWDGRTLYELYKQAYTPWEWHRAIKEECDRVGIDFLSTPFDKSAVDFLEEIGAEFYKIASFELVDIPLIEYVASKGKPIIMSCGLSKPEEIDEALIASYSQGNHNVILMKCCSEYPANFSDMNLEVISDMKERFNVPIGISDHSMGSLAAVAAVSLGACVVEKHFCINRVINTPDSEFSMEPLEFERMVKEVHSVKEIIGKKTYILSEKEKASIVFRRSVFAVKDIKEGEPFTENNIRVIRPGYGLMPKHYKNLLGLKAGENIKHGTPIQFNSIERETILFLTNNNISIDVYNRLKERESILLYNEKITLDFVKAVKPSFIISYNYKYIINKDIIRFMNNKIINMHISLLPWNRGASPNFFSFYDNTPKGVTIHIMDEGVDTGDILCQREIYIDETKESFESSYLFLNQQIQELFFENWDKIKDGKIKPIKQSGNGTYHTSAEMKEIRSKTPFNWSDNIMDFKISLGRKR